MSETIAAPATAAGSAAVAIVRLSGPLAGHILTRLFRPRSGRPPQLSPWRLGLGELVADNGAGAPRIIDECLAVFMPGPRSYTGEDVCELHLHGGRAVLERALGLALACGARLAQPGEFTRRAFLSGKLDLTQAEAVAELVSARSEAAARLAARQLSGGLSRRIEGLREGLAELLAQTEAAIDFPEDDLEPPSAAECARALRDGPLALVGELLCAATAAAPFREGASVVICGRPNVGKSTLLNALLGRERAITSPTPGTTRDFLEEGLVLGGVPVRLADTAGLREGVSGVEAQGVSLARGLVAECDLALAVLDASQPAEAADDALAAGLTQHPHLVLLNKADLPPRLGPEEAARLFPGAAGVLSLSALKGEGLPGLRERIVSLLAPAAPPEVAPNLRQRAALEAARQAMERALEALEAGLPPEILSAELRLALEAVGEITGETATEEILERIFSRFCIGK